MMYLVNSFSLSMVPDDAESATIWVRRLADAAAAQAALGKEFRSAVGHETTARLFSKELGLQVECNREAIKLKAGDVLVVGQYVGPRLPEGATELPQEAAIVWFRVEYGDGLWWG